MENDLARSPEDEDHDLLTFNESGVRLTKEIAATEAAIRGTSNSQERTALEERLAALRDALARNSRRAEATPGETGFLTYSPTGD